LEKAGVTEPAAAGSSMNEYYQSIGTTLSNETLLESLNIQQGHQPVHTLLITFVTGLGKLVMMLCQGPSVREIKSHISLLFCHYIRSGEVGFDDCPDISRRSLKYFVVCEHQDQQINEIIINAYVDISKEKMEAMKVTMVKKFQSFLTRGLSKLLPQPRKEPSQEHADESPDLPVSDPQNTKFAGVDAGQSGISETGVTTLEGDLVDLSNLLHLGPIPLAEARLIWSKHMITLHEGFLALLVAVSQVKENLISPCDIKSRWIMLLADRAERENILSTVSFTSSVELHVRDGSILVLKVFPKKTLFPVQVHSFREGAEKLEFIMSGTDGFELD
jgi:hypothetical protein